MTDGDVNPYGIVVVPQSFGRVVHGDTLVSNYNNKTNTQGTGTTIVEIAPTGARRLFGNISALPASEHCPGGIGLTTGLEVLPGGWVVVGSLPTTGGALPTQNPAGCLIVLNSAGVPVETWSNENINGPWDMTMQAGATHARLFISNVLTRPAGVVSSAPPTSGTCTVVRIDVSLVPGSKPVMTGATAVGSGFPWQANKAALVLGPTGLTLSSAGTLYVASTLNNTISAIPMAASRTTALAAGSAVLTTGGFLDAPLGLTLAPNGDLVAVNGNNGNAVEITQQGRQIPRVTLVRGGAGDLFGLTFAPGGQQLQFVNDGTNALDVFH